MGTQRTGSVRDPGKCSVNCLFQVWIPGEVSWLMHSLIPRLLSQYIYVHQTQRSCRAHGKAPELSQSPAPALGFRPPLLLVRRAHQVLEGQALCSKWEPSGHQTPLLRETWPHTQEDHLPTVPQPVKGQDY